MSVTNIVEEMAQAIGTMTIDQVGRGGLVVDLIGGPYDGNRYFVVFIGAEFWRGIELVLPTTTADAETGEATYAYYRVNVFQAQATFMYEQIEGNPFTDTQDAPV